MRPADCTLLQQAGLRHIPPAARGLYELVRSSKVLNQTERGKVSQRHCLKLLVRYRNRHLRRSGRPRSQFCEVSTVWLFFENKGDTPGEPFYPLTSIVGPGVIPLNRGVELLDQ